MKKETIIQLNFDEKNYISSFNKNKLSEELSNYILNECKGKSVKNKIILDITVNHNISKEEKEKITKMIHNNYMDDLKEYMIILKYSIIKKLLLFFIGVYLIYLNYFKFFDKMNIISEIMIIIAWVVIWETVYTCFFESDRSRIKSKRLKQLAKCQINFK